LNRAFNKTRRAVMRELPAAAAAAAAALQKNLQVAEFLPLLHCARRSGMVFIFVYDINTHTYIPCSMHAALQILTYIICAPNGLCVILRRILSFCDQAKLFCCWMLFARLFLPLRELMFLAGTRGKLLCRLSKSLCAASSRGAF